MKQPNLDDLTELRRELNGYLKDIQREKAEIRREKAEIRHEKEEIKAYVNGWRIGIAPLFQDKLNADIKKLTDDIEKYKETAQGAFSRIVIEFMHNLLGIKRKDGILSIQEQYELGRLLERARKHDERVESLEAMYIRYSHNVTNLTDL